MERETMELRTNKRRDELIEGDTVRTPGAVIAKLKVPSWYDEKKFNRAKELYRDNFSGINFGQFCGLILVFYFTKITKALASTGKSRTKNLLFHRYVQTIIDVQKWFEGDVWNINDCAHLTLSNVRSMHTRAGNKMAALNDGVVYISQWEMALTQWAMIGPFTLFPSLFGVHGWTNDDYDAMFHFWRTIGYLLGIEDKYNLCQGSYNEVLAVMEKLFQEDFKPRVETADPNSVVMAKNVTEAINKLAPFYTWPAIATYIYKLVDLPCPVAMGITDKFYYSLNYFLMNYLLKFDTVKNFVNKFYRRKLNDARKAAYQMMQEEKGKTF